MSQINILLFGPLEKSFGERNLSFEFEKNTLSVGEFREEIVSLHPFLSASSFTIAINQNIAQKHSLLRDGDEVALLPPICGGNISYLTRDKITRKYINQVLESCDSSCGSVLSFEGVVRADVLDEDETGNFVKFINYTSYDEMAEKEIGKIINDAIDEYGLVDVVVKHRIGIVNLNETAFFVAVFSAHRKEGIKAIDFIIDEVKKRVPIWKEEHYSNGADIYKSGHLITQAT